MLHIISQTALSFIPRILKDYFDVKHSLDRNCQKNVFIINKY